MVALLPPPAAGRPADAERAPRRRLLAGSALAGASSAGLVLAGCLAVAAAGWFAATGGTYGDLRDALRVGADAWLLAHGARLRLETATVSVVPLGLTLLSAYVAFRVAARAGSGEAGNGLRTAATTAATFAVGYGTVAAGTAALAALPSARPSVLQAFLGGFGLALVAGGSGVVAGSGRWPVERQRLPAWVRPMGAGAASVVLLMLLAGSLLVATALLLDFGAGVGVLSGLNLDVAGALTYTLLVAAVAPNAVLMGGAYLLGTGFVVGTGTVVSPTAVVLGPVPAFPLLAALPDDSATPRWVLLLTAVPVLAAAAATVLALRRSRGVCYVLAAMQGLGCGGLGGALFTLLLLLAGGSVGPGRMADVGAVLDLRLLVPVAAMAAGGLVAAVAWTWWARRGAAVPEPEPRATGCR